MVDWKDAIVIPYACEAERGEVLHVVELVMIIHADHRTAHRTGGFKSEN